MEIIQLVNGYSKGDGVGNVIAAIDSLLKSQGYETEIINQTLNFSDIDKEEFHEDNILLYHVALSVDPLVRYLKCKKILVFHNITDPSLLLGAGLQQMRTACSAGLYDIKPLSKYFESAIVFSKYSEDVLRENGWRDKHIYQIPIMVRFNNLSLPFDRDLANRYSDGKTNILFTGRIFPNKKQENIINSFAVYKKKFNIDSRLFLVGGVGNENYSDALKKYARELDVENDVVFTGKVPLSQYIAYYKMADVFLCMSAHEGFCIPLIEALYFNLPIIAVNSTAIPDTLNGSGILLNTRKPEEVASAINKLQTDSNYRSEILKGEKARLNELMPAALEKQYLTVLDDCIHSQSGSRMNEGMPEKPFLFDRLSIPESVRDKDNFIYGFGAAGGRLVDHLRDEGISIAGICDQKKAGTKERGIKILSPVEAFSKHKESNFIISIQDKKIIKTVICLMISSGVNECNIYLYDEVNDRIV